MFTIECPQIMRQIGKGYCADESTRYAINGVRIEAVKGKAIAVATDGRKLCAAVVGKADEDAHAVLMTVAIIDRVLNHNDMKGFEFSYRASW